LNNTLSGEAAVGLSAIRGELDEIGPDPLVSLLEVVTGPRFRRDVRPSVLQMRVSRCLEKRKGRCQEGGKKNLLNKTHPYTIGFTARWVGNLI
jgi:hypothetical protein